MSDASRPISELPRWQSHKIVQGARITGVSEGSLPDVLFVWHLEGGFSIEVDEDLARRIPRGVFSPTGGYLVIYEDGYRSWSPAEAFEAGYTKIATEA
jgi:hypothetical protein